MTGTSG